jgi:RNA polymerase sigma-70 factor (ECF subfamily)
MEALLRRHYDRWFALSRRLMGSAADAHDATQEAVISIVRGLARFDGRSSFTTWSYRVVTNACLDELRRQKRRPVAAVQRDDADHPLREIADASAPFDERLVDRDALDSALARISVEFREPVILRDLCGLDYQDIAELLDIPPGTVRSRISRGRSALAGLLGGNQPPLPGVQGSHDE